MATTLTRLRQGFQRLEDEELKRIRGGWEVPGGCRSLTPGNQARSHVGPRRRGNLADVCAVRITAEIAHPVAIHPIVGHPASS